MTHLLEEQRRFVDQVTSFQLSGITRNEMYLKKDAGITTYDMLFDFEGVKSVEQTYLTDRQGQWMLIVHKSQIEGLKKYIQTKLPEIYQNKGGTKQWIVTHQHACSSQNEGMRIMDRNRSGLSTYAEVLRRRFDGATGASHGVVGNGLTSVPHTTKVNPATTGQSNRETVQKQGTESVPYRPVQASGDNQSVGLSMDRVHRSTSVNTQDHFTTEDKTSGNSSSHTPEKETKSILTVCQRYEDKFARSEKNFQDKLEALETRQTEILKGYDTLIADTIDKKINKRFSQVSQEVADTVTARMMHAMSVFFKKNPPDHIPDTTTPSEVITQDSPLKGFNTTTTDNIQTDFDNKQEIIHQTTQNTSHPHTALVDKQIPNQFVNDSPHDNPAFESSSEIIK